MGVELAHCRAAVVGAATAFLYLCQAAQGVLTPLCLLVVNAGDPAGCAIVAMPDAASLACVVDWYLVLVCISRHAKLINQGCK